MVDTVFKAYSKPIGEAYSEFIENFFCDPNNRITKLFSLYKEYALLDANFPRPILTFLGINANANVLKDISDFEDMPLLFIPQLIRDFLAIHDDIIDEDLVKFKSDTLPFSFSKVVEPHTLSLNKWGKDVALLFADMQLSAPLKIISSLSVSATTKQRLLDLVSQILYTTNHGQIDELLLNGIPLENISLADIESLYRNKAADYCYAFPLTLGMVYSNLDSQTVDDARSVLLKLGTFSQVINDLEGVFFEHFSNNENTMSDLTLLRRTWLLVKFYHKTSSTRNRSLLNQPYLTEEQAAIIKNEMLESGVLADLRSELEVGCQQIEAVIRQLNIGEVLRAYLLGLVNNRIIVNLSRL